MNRGSLLEDLAEPGTGEDPDLGDTVPLTDSAAGDTAGAEAADSTPPPGGDR